MVRRGRRLKSNGTATLEADLWEADYEVDVPSEQAESVSRVVHAMSGNTTTLREQMEDELAGEGVGKAAIERYFVMRNFTAEVLDLDQSSSSHAESPTSTQGIPLPTLIGGIVGAVAGLSCMAVYLYMCIGRSKPQCAKSYLSNASERGAHVGDSRRNDSDDDTPRFSV